MIPISNKKELEELLFGLETRNVKLPEYFILTDDEYKKVVGSDPKIMQSRQIFTFQGMISRSKIVSNYQWEVMQEARRMFERENRAQKETQKKPPSDEFVEGI